MHYLLVYDLAPDYLSRRGEFRAEHLALAWASHDRGEMVLGGAVGSPTGPGDPVDTAILMFQGDSPAAAEAFAKADPYVKHGLVARWRVRSWTTVVGASAATPVRPAPESR